MDAPERPHDASGDMRVRVVGELGEAEICNLHGAWHSQSDHEASSCQHSTCDRKLNPSQSCLCFERIIEQNVGGLDVPVDDPRVTWKVQHQMRGTCELW